MTFEYDRSASNSSTKKLVNRSCGATTHKHAVVATHTQFIATTRTDKLWYMNTATCLLHVYNNNLNMRQCRHFLTAQAHIVGSPINLENSKSGEAHTFLLKQHSFF